MDEQVPVPEVEMRSGKGVAAPLVTASRALTGSGTFKGHYSLVVDTRALAPGNIMSFSKAPEEKRLSLQVCQSQLPRP